MLLVGSYGPSVTMTSACWPPTGRVLAAERIADGVAEVARLHGLIAVHADAPGEVVVGIETARGCWSGPWSRPATRRWR